MKRKRVFVALSAGMMSVAAFAQTKAVRVESPIVSEKDFVISSSISTYLANESMINGRRWNYMPPIHPRRCRLLSLNASTPAADMCTLN